MSDFFSKAFSFKGSTNRKNYWLTAIFVSLINFVIIGSLILLNYLLISNYMELNSTGQIIAGLFIALFELYISIASISMSIRRLHSAGFKGYLWFINLIPIIGNIAFFVLMLMPNKDENISNDVINEFQENTDYNLEQETTSEDLEHKIPLKEKIVGYITETDLSSFVFLLDGETTSSYVKKRLKKSVAIFLSLLSIIVLINVINLIFKLNFEINDGLFLGLSLAIAYIIYKLDYLLLKSVFKQQQKSIKNTFPLWMATLEILIVTNNIPNTLEKSLLSCPKPIKKDLEKLVLKLNRNPVDKEAYASFLAEYNIPEIQEIVLDLYQFNFIEKDNISKEFSALHNRINRIASDSRKERQEQEKIFIGAINSIPLLIISFYILMISNLLSSAIMS